MTTIHVRGGIEYVNVTLTIPKTAREKATSDKINLSATLLSAMNTAPVKKVGN